MDTEDLSLSLFDEIVYRGADQDYHIETKRGFSFSWVVVIGEKTNPVIFLGVMANKPVFWDQTLHWAISCENYIFYPFHVTELAMVLLYSKRAKHNGIPLLNADVFQRIIDKGYPGDDPFTRQNAIPGFGYASIQTAFSSLAELKPTLSNPDIIEDDSLSTLVLSGNKPKIFPSVQSQSNSVLQTIATSQPAPLYSKKHERDQIDRILWQDLETLRKNKDPQLIPPIKPIALLQHCLKIFNKKRCDSLKQYCLRTLILQIEISPLEDVLQFYQSLCQVETLSTELFQAITVRFVMLCREPPLFNSFPWTICKKILTRDEIVRLLEMTIEYIFIVKPYCYSADYDMIQAYEYALRKIECSQTHDATSSCTDCLRESIRKNLFDSLEHLRKDSNVTFELFRVLCEASESWKNSLVFEFMLELACNFDLNKLSEKQLLVGSLFWNLISDTSDRLKREREELLALEDEMFNEIQDQEEEEEEEFIEEGE